MVFDWSSKSRKRHRHSSSCSQSERIRWKIFFCKEYYIWDCTHNIFNFNKYFVYHFPICFANFAGPIHEICAYKFLACSVGHLCLSSLLLEDWSLLRRWHLKELKLCMSTSVMTRSSLHNWHTTSLRPPWLVANKNQHFHFQENK